MARARSKVEFGDFQTPPDLADAVCDAVARSCFAAPRAVLEPTCGRGALLLAAIARFPRIEVALGYDVDEAYVAEAGQLLKEHEAGHGSRPLRGSVSMGNFFSTDWSSVLASLPSPLLVIGNPPWVTNSGQGAIGGRNLPPKANGELAGLDALTGKSNFDISEWMIDELLRRLERPGDVLAMLCKTTVARKLLVRVWRRTPDGFRASIRRIDAKRGFGAAVDACLVTFVRGQEGTRQSEVDGREVAARAAVEGPVCPLYESLEAPVPSSTLGFRDGRIVADLAAHAAVARFVRTPRPASGQQPRWRSGIKHDCSKVMELTRPEPSGAGRSGVGVGAEVGVVPGSPGARDGIGVLDGAGSPAGPGPPAGFGPRHGSGPPDDAQIHEYVNGLGERVWLEGRYVFPLLKGTEVARGRAERGQARGTRWVLVPQRVVGQDTGAIEHEAPHTWAYLTRHADRLGRRSSSIYRGKPRFSVFGVGPYSFAEWKVAVSGLHKEVRFRVVGPRDGKPTLLDDTCYFLPFGREEPAARVRELLSSAPARRFLQAFVFPDAKRPITSELLGALDLAALAEAAGEDAEQLFGRAMFS